MFLVVGATGHLGGMITRNLLTEGCSTRILARDGAKFQPLLEAGAQVVTGSLQAPQALQAACQGITTLIATAGTQTLDYNAAVQANDVLGYQHLIRAAQACGVRQFIFISALGADAHSPVPYLAAKGQVEAGLRSSGLAYTIWQPSYFMDFWFMGLILGPAANGQPVWVLGDGSDPHSPIAAGDVAKLVVQARDHPAAHNRVIPIVGPQPLSLRDAAATAQAVLGRPVSIQSFDPAAPPPELPPLAVQLMTLGAALRPPVDPQAAAAEFGVRLTTLDEYVRAVMAAPA